MNRYYNTNPSKDLSYSSLALDEQNRSQHAHKIGDSARFRPTPVNGNIASVAPEAQDADLRQSLPRHMQVDTTTRTVFQDNFYKPKDGIAEYVADPLKGASAPRAQPHMPLSDLAPSDPRVRKLRPAYEAPLAPGYYEPDPLGERATGTLNMAAGEVHHGVPLARDPTRASAVFVAAPRGRTARDIADEAASPPISSRMTQPDYAHWTSKGCWAPRGDRVIEAERWGRNAREPKPPAEERPQSVYTPMVTTDGHPNSSEAYAAARYTPAYKAAFASGLPRTLALPGGNRPDTRLQVKTYDDVCGAGPDVGPGSYNPEPPRMRSSNAAFDSSAPYFSLASGTPRPGLTVNTSFGGSGPLSPQRSGGTGSASSPLGLLPPQLQHQLAATGSFHSLASPSSPTTPHSPSRLGGGGGGINPLSIAPPLGPSGAGAASGRYSEPSSPSALRAAAVRAERIAAAQLLATTSGRERSPTRGGHHAPSPLGQPSHSLPVQPSRGSVSSSHPHHYQPGFQHPGMEHGMHLPGVDVGVNHSGPGVPTYPDGPSTRAQSAPVTARTGTSASASMRAAQAKHFNKLVFMQRHTPCSSLLRSHLVVAADLRQERQRLRNG
ncbi:hypothetical protein CHLRE_03g169750v5 [Chlamydomonas reinhardtii]|uniref:Uncharacterized protein n=1 Tax=Chlamydomonas reinhardtii TaxID=3055 RepID=A8IEU5_CHLRE|nr:uncharacterized protein CHLRE_03g169750v5 [Chlamydomonas reinhardtii]PNW85054.1 hypothetical protein CHLRE_03g169750v5 [Chlamydomonas reinhardtii]|eukprot:XP_001703493.1 predicted protein [Chlamydomonas reinhardtii]